MRPTHPRRRLEAPSYSPISKVRACGAGGWAAAPLASSADVCWERRGSVGVPVDLQVDLVLKRRSVAPMQEVPDSLGSDHTAVLVKFLAAHAALGFFDHSEVLKPAFFRRRDVVGVDMIPIGAGGQKSETCVMALDCLVSSGGVCVAECIDCAIAPVSSDIVFIENRRRSQVTRWRDVKRIVGLLRRYQGASLSEHSKAGLVTRRQRFGLGDDVIGCFVRHRERSGGVALGLLSSFKTHSLRAVSQSISSLGRVLRLRRAAVC